MEIVCNRHLAENNCDRLPTILLIDPSVNNSHIQYQYWPHKFDLRLRGGRYATVVFNTALFLIDFEKRSIFKPMKKILTLSQHILFCIQAGLELFRNISRPNSFSLTELPTKDFIFWYAVQSRYVFAVIGIPRFSQLLNVDT